MKRVSILGSTGSVGEQTLDVIARNPDRFRVVPEGSSWRFDLGVCHLEAGAVLHATGDPVGGDVGVGVTTHQETPGVGSLAKTDPAFAAQFKGMPFKDQFTVKTDGGQVDSISGATVTSRGVALAITDAVQIYEKLKPQIAEKAKEFAK